MSTDGRTFERTIERIKPHVVLQGGWSFFLINWGSGSWSEEQRPEAERTPAATWLENEIGAGIGEEGFGNEKRRERISTRQI